MGSVVSREPGDKYRLLLVGLTGAGKSATGNSILGRDAFQSRSSFHSITTHCSLKSAVRNDIELQVVDTPGVLDLDRNIENISSAIVKFMAGVSPGPHAILLVMRASHRYTEEVDKAFYEAKKILGGREFLKRVVLVFTDGDILKEEKVDMAQEIKKCRHLTKVVQETGERYVVFDNKATGSRQRAQVEDLLRLVRQVCGPDVTYLSNPSQDKVNEIIDKEAAAIAASTDIPVATAKLQVCNAMVDATEEDPLLMEAVRHVREEIEARAIDLMICDIL